MSAAEISRPENKTFYHDNLLPSLPLPSIHQTIEKYLDSCRAVLTEEEYKNTESVCQKFKEDDAMTLQVLLMQKAIKQRNWLEPWWLDKAYLEVRQPIMYSYFGGPAPYFEDDIWPLQSHAQLDRAAMGIYLLMQFWHEIKTEKSPQHKSGDGESQTMHQLRYMFNTCRVPKPGRDEVYHGFKTSSEGDSPTHIIVFCKNRMYKMQGVNRKTGEIHSPPEFHRMLSGIKNNAPAEHGVGVAAMTCLDRDTWSDARAYMVDLSSMNEKNLLDIQSAVVCLSLDESSPENYTEILRESLCGPCGNKWSDKSFNYLCTANGAFMSNDDHTPYEAMVLIAFVAFTFDAIKRMKGKYHSWKSGEVEPVTELVFDLDERLHRYIQQGYEEYEKYSSNINVKMTEFVRFGKSSLKALKVHPDAFIQICIQLAYMRLHGKPAPTYETATTRSFYQARTETCRTCTPEAVAFCKAMMEGSEDVFVQFRKAHDKFLWLMKECKQNRGCDRHLFGLALQAMETGEPLPALFSDPAYVKTGGNGNFILSTSLTGYSHGTGGTAPMREDGYGFFYRILPSQFMFSVASWNSCLETSTEKFTNEVCRAFNDVHDMLKENNPSKL